MVIPNMSALDLSQAIHRKQVSCREVMTSYLAQIQTHNGNSNALVSLAEPEAVLAMADERDAQLSRGESMGWMHGMPAISVPAGFNAQGLPMGLQLIGKPQGDFELLQVAYAYEQAAQDLIQTRPPGI
jgi:amidase